MGKVIALPTTLESPAEKLTRTRLDVVEVTAALLDTWALPPAQRQLKVTPRVIEVAAEIAESQVIPGIVTLGLLRGKTVVLDGQHRLHAFRLSGVPMAYADMRIIHCATEAAAGSEFVRLNSALVKMRPDDILRGLECALPALASVRARCPFVGYDMVRRGDHAPIVSMSVVLRAWRAAQNEVPGNGGAARECAELLLQDEADRLVEFLDIVQRAWGRDPEYMRLWGALNLTLVMWIYRRLVLTTGLPFKRATRLTKPQFQKAAMSLSASPVYLDWLRGRLVRETDRSPCYARMRSLMVKRLTEELGGRVLFPTAAWVGHLTMDFGK